MIGRTDSQSGATVTINLAHTHVHDGRMYEISYKTPDGSPVVDNGSLDFLFKPNLARCFFSFGPIAANPIEVQFYESPTITNVGSSLNVVGMNRIRTIPPAAVSYLSPTVAAVGDLLRSGMQVWGLASPTPAFVETPWILKRSTDYLMRIINRSGSSQDIGMTIQWFEELV